MLLNAKNLLLVFPESIGKAHILDIAHHQNLLAIICWGDLAPTYAPPTTIAKIRILILESTIGT